MRAAAESKYRTDGASQVSAVVNTYARGSLFLILTLVVRASPVPTPVHPRIYNRLAAPRSVASCRRAPPSLVSALSSSAASRFSGTTTSFPFPRERTREKGEMWCERRRKRRDKGCAHRPGFTSRHQRNCMRGNKQNYKARRSGLLFHNFFSSRAAFLTPIFLIVPLFSPARDFPSFARWKLLARLSSYLPSCGFSPRIEKRVCARVTHTRRSLARVSSTGWRSGT